MKPVAPPIIAPLSAFETRVRGAYVQHDKEAIGAVVGPGSSRLGGGDADAQVARLLQASDRGMLVTPEGLGCFLGETGVHVDDA
jgi:hypothetical protein